MYNSVEQTLVTKKNQIKLTIKTVITHLKTNYLNLQKDISSSQSLHSYNNTRRQRRIKTQAASIEMSLS